MSRIPIIIEKLKKCGLLGLRSPLSFSFKILKLSLRKVVCRGMSVVQNSNNSWQKLQSYGWNTPFLKTDETEMTFNHKLSLSHSEISHLSANNFYHTLAVSSINCWREWLCKFFPWERRASLGSCGVPVGPTPNLTLPDSSPISWWWHIQKSSF